MHTNLEIILMGNIILELNFVKEQYFQSLILLFRNNPIKQVFRELILSNLYYRLVIPSEWLFQLVSAQYSSPPIMIL